MALVESQLLFDYASRYQAYLERAKAGLVQTYDPVLREMERELRAALNATGSGSLGDLSRPQFARLLQSMISITDRHTREFAQQLLGRLREVAGYAAEFETASLVGAVKPTVAVVEAPFAVEVGVRLMVESPVQASGMLLEPTLEDWRRTVRTTVEKVVRNSRAQARTVPQTIRDLRGTQAARNTDGALTGTSRRTTQSTIRTATQHAAASGRQGAQEVNAGIVQQYRWVSLMDGRVTQQCRSLDGMLFRVGEGPMPPIHFNCRSTTVVVLDQSILNADAARRGREPKEVLTYYKWLKDQPEQFQNDVLGVKRARLFRDGGLSAEEFARLNIDRNFEPLTLEEMRILAPNAFLRAGI